MLKQDYLVRSINGNVRTMLRMAFDMDSNNEVEFEEEMLGKYMNFLQMIDKGEVNEAENILMEELDPANMNQFELALRFYSYLNRKDDDFLEECNYSREEVSDGIKHAAKIYGYAGLV